MRIMKKLLVLALAGVVSFACLSGAACGGAKHRNDENYVEIQIYDRGYGTAGIRAVADKFMEKNSDITIGFTAVNDNTLATDIYTGPSTTSTDLYLYGGDNFFNLINSGSVVLEGTRYDNYFEPLTDVALAVPDGESRYIKDKMLDSYEEYYNLKDGVKWKEDTYYCLPWIGGMTGIIYNSKMFDNYGWEIPLTTDQLVEVCKDIVAEEIYSTNKNSVGQKINVAPFSYCIDASYWREIYMVWWAQYDGVNTFENFFKGQDANGNYTPNIAASEGRRYMFEVMDQLLGTYVKEGDNVTARPASEVFCDPTLCTRSYIDTQSTFMNAEAARVNTNGATTSAMMPNGDWLENEMYNNFSSQIQSGEVEFKMMKTPVTSAILNHKDCESIADDNELRALITAIDSGSESLTGEGYDVEQAAFDKVKAARGVALGSNRYSAYIPVFSNAKEAAKKFLIFMYSDEGLAINAQTTRGQDMPFEYDYESLDGISTFHQSKFDVYATNADYVFNADKYAVCYRGQLNPFMVYHPIENKFNVSSQRDYVDPYKIFVENYNEINRRWNNIMSDAGIDW